ncbi:sugar ABC transporter substrate-binding protein [Dactylosporangium sp. AC04546]|uniref:ABC transporter substrate-binding protein n=1 Tax=Dactylosporangium sp. AC04546 TaxID=2862460 RepID=UPI001EE07812|nr:sugar ABC transporter substrate-binding protein [Dactylosporangium sp. AC04546]WVK87914.1 sugar ABC transporter substrate-binding protein [Dactylosporangium sp. AC04546]
MPSTHTRRGFLKAAAGAALLAACGDDDTDTPTSGGPDDPADLQFWTWATNIEQVVDIWNKKNPTQKVTVNRLAQGEELITKILTAHRAGNAPDLMQAEYQALPVLITNGVAKDLSAVASSVKSEFTDGTWSLTSFGGKTYGIPQDVGPMMLYYREDLFTQYGLTVPKTWAEFAEVAKVVRQKDPKRYLATFSSGDPGWFAGLAEQAGANWWANDNGTWTVAINDAATKKVADFWGKLVNDGTLSGKPMYTPEWNTAMSDGTLLAWPSAIWGAGVLEGVAGSTKGKWKMVPMPQWDAGAPATGYWGGSATAIWAKSKQQAQAEKFVKWLNTDPESVELLVSAGGIYPASTKGQSTPALSKAPAMMPNQPTFYADAAAIAKTARGFNWAPNVNVTYSQYSDIFAKAIQDKGDFTAATDALQAASVADLKKQGFTVKGA